MTPVIETARLTKRYGDTLALDSLDLTVEPAQVFGYLGPNGAGKTTTIRLLMGLLRPSGGSALVFGHDVVDERSRVQASVGYLPGDYAAYSHLTAAAYLGYMASLRSGRGSDVFPALAERLGLPLDGRIGDLSHGNRQKVGIVQAFMHEPELLILDEPTSGLDPFVQREFLTMLREVRSEGRTVFLSSHVLAEVEAVADTVAIVHAGRLMLVAELESLKRSTTHRYDFELAGPAPTERIAAIEGVRAVDRANGTLSVVVEGPAARLFEALAPFGIQRVRTHEDDLEEIFFRHSGGDR